MLAGGRRMLTGRERDGDGGGTVAGRPAAGSGAGMFGMFGPVTDRAMRVVISSSPADGAGGRMLRFTCEAGFPPSLEGDD